MLTADWKLIRIGLGSTYDILWVLQDVLEGLGPVTALGDAISLYIKLEAVRYTEMSVCPISRGRLFATMRCPCVQFPVEGVRLFATLRCPDVQFPVERGHTNISLYERLPGDIRTSHCMNSSQGTYGHLTVRTAPRRHTDISLYEWLPGDIWTSHSTNGSQGTYVHLTVQTAFRGVQGQGEHKGRGMLWYG